MTDETREQDEFFKRMDRMHMLASVRAKRDKGERLNRSERVAIAADDAIAAMRRIRQAKGNINRVAEMLLQQMAGLTIAYAERVNALEDRIAELEGGTAEAAAKPPNIRVVSR